MARSTQINSGDSNSSTQTTILNNLRPEQYITKPIQPTDSNNTDTSDTNTPSTTPTTADITNITTTSVVGVSSLPDVKQPYPFEVGIDPSSKYTVSNDTIKFTGKYDENFINFKTYSVDDILSLDIAEYPTSFNFIVEFIDESTREFWSSPDLVAQLRAETQAGNPYTNRKTVPVIQFDFKFIKNYGTAEQFKIPEDYAEVEVLSTITSKEDVLKHINWLVSSDTSLRPASEMGSWELQLTETLGMDHSRELDALNSKLINEESNISENIRPDDYDDSDSSTDSFIEFSPFGVPGQRAHERRRYNGTLYSWSEGNNTWFIITE